MPVTEPASLACAMSLLFLLLGDSVQVRGPALSGTVHQGKPEIVEVSLETAAVLTTEAWWGRACAAGAAPGRGEGGEGAVTWGGERGVGIPGEG